MKKDKGVDITDYCCPWRDWIPTKEEVDLED